jgi:hypothetical protein
MKSFMVNSRIRMDGAENVSRRCKGAIWIFGFAIGVRAIKLSLPGPLRCEDGGTSDPAMVDAYADRQRASPAMKGASASASVALGGAGQFFVFPTDFRPRFGAAIAAQPPLDYHHHA